MNGVSVIICCYNSALKLPQALAYLAKQKTGSTLDWEIIVVDNNCTDNTASTARQTWGLLGCKKELSIVTESKAGLSYARETGVKAARYGIIVFCDDDNLLTETYLQYAYHLVAQTIKSKYGIWGGKTVAYFDADTIVPDWFEKEKTNYVVGEQGSETGDISERSYVWGAGMIILKSVYLKIINGNFPSLLKDRTGEALTSGGDSEISLRTLIAGYKLYYDENLVLKHYISKDRLTEDYNKELIRGFVSSNNVLNKYRIFIHYISGRSLFSRTYYAGIYLVKYLLDRIKLRELTAYDNVVLHALFNSKKFQDDDFNLMRGLLKIKNSI